MRLAPLATVLALTALAGGAGHSVAASTGGAGGYRILLTSNRDGRMRGYSIRPDGSRLTPLLPRSRSEVAVTVSGDGRIVAYPGRGGTIYVSSASGAGLRRVVPDAAVGAALSRDGKLLAFGTGSTISIVGTDGRGRRRVTSGDDWSPDWSPGGRALAFVHDLGDDREALAVQPLQAARRLLAQAEWVDTPKWSPDGRWIAYLAEDSLYVVRPDGSDPRLLAPAFEVDDLSWSPDGRRVALANNGDVLVVDLDGRQRRLHLPRLYVGAVAWAPDGARLALTGGTTSQIWIVRTDGRGLRRVTSSGRNGFVGWTRLAPILPPARPLPRAERIVGRRTLVLRTAVTSIAAAGGRVASSPARRRRTATASRSGRRRRRRSGGAGPLHVDLANTWTR